MTEAQVVKKVRGNVFSCLLKGFGLGFKLVFDQECHTFVLLDVLFYFI